MFDGGIHRLSVLGINWCIGDISDGAFYYCRIPALAVSGFSEPNYTQVFLAINDCGDCRGDTGHWVDVFDLICHCEPAKQSIPFVIANEVKQSSHAVIPYLIWNQARRTTLHRRF